jgi:RNA polymerase sigma factor (sigma-70 family)
MDDWQLLKSYARDDSQDAFAEIVRRHVNLVYSAALRQVQEPELARDVTQLVFANLAHRAKSLKPKGTLAGWLYSDASLTSREILRRERRRVVREQEAVAMQDVEISQDWALIRPGLDAALTQLGKTDRDAVLLRFFEQRSLKDIGAALGMEEDTARKRVSRALEKLRMQLARQGVTTTDDALSGALTTHAVEAAPAGIVAGVVATSVTAASTAAATGTTTFIELLTMTTKLKATVAAAALLAGVGTPLFMQHAENKSLRLQNQALVAQASQFATLEEENQRLSNRIALSANANGTAVSDQERVELNRLRAEVATLRGEAKQTQQMRAEIDRLRSGGRAVPLESAATTEALASYLGEAVPPPVDIDIAYTREGLLNSIQQAAQLAGVLLKKLEIDTSEFPFLAGVVCDSNADFEKLKAQFKNMPNYEWGASVSSRGECAFNITPLRSFSSEERQRIVRRTLLRAGLFKDQLAAR